MSSAKIQPAADLVLTDPAAEAAGQRASAQEDVLVLFDECAVRLRRYLASFGLGAAATEDILQEVFLSLNRHLQLGRPRTNLQAWLFRVGHNLALKQQQRRLRRQESERPWDANLAERIVDPVANPEEQLADSRRRQRLRAVALALPERDRRCLSLRAAGLHYREIAVALGISLGSVANSLTRAVTRLAAADQE